MWDDILRGIINLWRGWNHPDIPQSFGVERGGETFWIVMGVLLVAGLIAQNILNDKNKK